jgi:gag-polypeptide of LTR copia-type
MLLTSKCSSNLTMSSNTTSLVPILDGGNYNAWSKAMHTFLMSLGIWGYADGSITEPAEAHAGHPKWAKGHTMALGNIVLRVNAVIQ